MTSNFYLFVAFVLDKGNGRAISFDWNCRHYFYCVSTHKSEMV